MKATIYIALFAWPIVTLILCTIFTVRKAMIYNFVIGWLILPVARVPLSAMPDYDKFAAVSMAAVLGVLIFDRKRLVTLRLTALDLPMAIFCLCPLLSSLSNELGVYDGLSGMLINTLRWGIPYIIGRLYGGDPNGMRDIATGFFVGVLLYVPVCIWEIRLSPTLNHTVYGFVAQYFFTTERLGGYRPVGFLSHGIELGMLMMSGTFIGIWMRKSGAWPRFAGVSSLWIVFPLFIVFILCRALGAWILMAGGLAALFFSKWTRTRLAVVMIMIAPLVYIGGRMSGVLSDDLFVSPIAQVSVDRSKSLAARLYHEGQLVDKALERPVFGWGKWGRNRVYDDNIDISITDGLWIIIFGQQGFVGLASWFGALLIPGAVFLKRGTPHVLLHPLLAPALAFSILIPLNCIDWLMNAFHNPMYIVMSGSLVAIQPWMVRAVSGAARRPATTPKVN